MSSDFDPTSAIQFEQDLEAAVRHETRDLRLRLDESRAEVKELRSMLRFYDAAKDAPIQVPSWRLPARPVSHNEGIVFAQLADWHLDEVVKPDEILGLNAFSRSIALQRIERWTEKVITLPRRYINGLDIRGLIIPSTGDLFTGEIHDELKNTNEDRVLESLLWWMEPIIAMLELLDAEYPAVELDAVPGNHGRMAKEYSHKGRVSDSLESFFWRLVKARLEDRGRTQNTTINVSPSANMNIEVYGRNYLLDHGYEFRGGTGISGAFAPLSLGAHRKNLRQTVADMPMHTMIVGHMHQLINIPGVIMGGTLKGYDEYAFNLNLRPDENGAGQAMWVTSPERAQVLWMPIYVTDRAAEGW